MKPVLRMVFVFLFLWLLLSAPSDSSLSVFSLSLSCVTSAKEMESFTVLFMKQKTTISLLRARTREKKTPIVYRPLQLSLKITLSSRTSSLDVQRAIEASIEKRTKDSFGPPMGKRLAVFIDDLNASKIDW